MAKDTPKEYDHTVARAALRQWRRDNMYSAVHKLAPALESAMCKIEQQADTIYRLEQQLEKAGK